VLRQVSLGNGGGVIGRTAIENFSEKIQWIYNGKCAPITMQGLATAREKPPAQEQWKNNKKQCAEQWKQSEIRAHADRILGHSDALQKQSPAAERRRARISVTRISTIAHPSAERT
jgi:hypothetical protein